jgi:hypothetical protein
VIAVDLDLDVADPADVGGQVFGALADEALAPQWPCCGSWCRMAVVATVWCHDLLSCRGQSDDLYEVVGEDSVSAPGGGAVASGDGAAGPVIAVLEVADAALASGSPLDEVAEASAVFGGSPGRTRLSFSRYGNGFHAQPAQLGFDARLSGSAVGGHCGRRSAAAFRDAPDGRSKFEVGQVGAQVRPRVNQAPDCNPMSNSRRVCPHVRRSRLESVG